MSFVVAILLALIAGAGVSLFAGENPIEVYRILIEGSFGSANNLGYTLFYATPFIFTGLAVAVPYRAGLFNIGGEGQIYAGAIGLFSALTYLPDLGPIFTPLCAIAGGCLGGALWGGIAGAAKAFRGSHEVITTIMLNFIGISLSSYFILYHWKDPLSQASETVRVSESAHLARLHLGDSPFNLAFILALLAAGAVWFFLEKTRKGFDLRAAGLNPDASRTAGISVNKAILLSMCLGGALASGVVVNEVLGNFHRLRDSFSPGFGFVGIAVAFLGKNHPAGIVLSALFFGALFKGAGELDIETEFMTRDFATVMQAIFIAAVSAESAIQVFLRRRRDRKRGAV